MTRLGRTKGCFTANDGVASMPLDLTGLIVAKRSSGRHIDIGGLIVRRFGRREPAEVMTQA
jgi:hypothetical protein